MSYSPNGMLDDNNNKTPPDPRFSEWHKRSKKELIERLFEAIDKRRDATQELIPKMIVSELKLYGLYVMRGEDSNYFYNISDDNVMRITKELINKQINEWKGLRWWRFNEKNTCDSWSKWFKKAKCWQDQNQHKPLGRFWCLIFDELKQYTNDIAYNMFSSNENTENTKLKIDTLSACLYGKCILSILKGTVRFERTRETPLLPVRVLTQSKELQQQLYKINNGFTLSFWKQEAEQKHKRQKQQSHKRSNVATVLNDKVAKHALYMYQTSVKSLKQIMPDLNIPRQSQSQSPSRSPSQSHAINYNSNNGYGPSRGPSANILRVESQRYSPILSSDVSSMTSSMVSDAASISSSHSSHSSHSSSPLGNVHVRRRIPPCVIASMPPKPPIPSEASEYNQLERENQHLRAELAAIRRELVNKQSSSNMQSVMINQINMQNRINQIMMENNQARAPRIPSPMHVRIPQSIHVNDKNGGQGIYQPNDGTMFLFPTHENIRQTNNQNNNSQNSNNIDIDIDDIINNTNNTNNMTMHIDSSDIINNMQPQPQLRSQPQTPGIYSRSPTYPFDDDRMIGSVFEDYSSYPPPVPSVPSYPYPCVSHPSYPPYPYPIYPSYPPFHPLRETFDANTCFNEHPTQSHYH